MNLRWFKKLDGTKELQVLNSFYNNKSDIKPTRMSWDPLPTEEEPPKIVTDPNGSSWAWIDGKWVRCLKDNGDVRTANWAQPSWYMPPKSKAREFTIFRYDNQLGWFVDHIDLPRSNCAEMIRVREIIEGEK